MQITQLPIFDYLRVSGADARSFLQGQLTCNLDLLNQRTALPGAICNLKGRVIANFVVLQDGDDCLLQSIAGTGPKLQETLAKYAVFSKVELQPIAGPVKVLGVIGDAAATAFAEVLPAFPEVDYACLVTADFRLVRLPGSTPRFQIWCLNDAAAARLQMLDVMEEQQDIGVWQRAEISAGLFHVAPDMSEEFTPQLLNYDISGTVDFKKGCYTGQEVVARMYYRGKAKKRMYLLSSEQPFEVSSTITASSGDQHTDIAAQFLACSNAAGPEPYLALAILPAQIAEAEPPATLKMAGKYSVEILAMPYTE